MYTNQEFFSVHVCDAVLKQFVCCHLEVFMVHTGT